MPKLYLSEALALLGKTLPFVWVRLGSYAVLFVALALYFGVVGGLAFLLGRLWAPLGFITFLIAIGGGFGLLRWVSRYYFYLLKAAHVAVMTEFVVHGQAPAEGQIAYGKRQVTERFRDTSVMFAVDVLVDGAVKAVVRTFARIASILPIPGLDSLTKLLERVAIASTTYVDEAVLSRAYARREQNVWKVAHDGVILYAQAWKPILANALVLTLIGYVEFIVFLLILAAPAFAFAAAFPAMAPVAAIMAFAGAWLLKLALADPFAMAATLLAYHRSTAGMEPDPEWKAKLEGASTKFQELGRKAVEAVQSRAPGSAGGASASTPSAPSGPPTVPSDPPPVPPGPSAPPIQDPPGAPPAPPTPDVPPGPDEPPAPEAPPAPGAPPEIEVPPAPEAPPAPRVPPGPDAAGVDQRTDPNRG